MANRPTQPKVGYKKLTSANASLEGTGANSAVILTAGTRGIVVDEIVVRPVGQNVATVLRLFLNNGQDINTAQNNALIHEVPIDATSAISQTTAYSGYRVEIAGNDGELKPPIPYLPSGHSLFATIGTAVAGGLVVSCFGTEMSDPVGQL